jgi:hypothetical protein
MNEPLTPKVLAAANFREEYYHKENAMSMKNFGLFQVIFPLIAPFDL